MGDHPHLGVVEVQAGDGTPQGAGQEPHAAPDDLPSQPEEVLEVGAWHLSLAPLFGHTRGHCGVLLRSNDAALLHVGDTYYDSSELESDGSFLFRRFRASVDQDARAAGDARRTVARWKRENPEVRLFSSHDPAEFEAAVAAG